MQSLRELLFRRLWRGGIHEKCDETFSVIGTVSAFHEPVQITNIAHGVDLDVEEQFDISRWQRYGRPQVWLAVFCSQELRARVQFFEAPRADPGKYRFFAHDKIGRFDLRKFADRAYA